jgi:hypothetical protein
MMPSGSIQRPSTGKNQNSEPISSASPSAMRHYFERGTFTLKRPKPTFGGTLGWSSPVMLSGLEPMRWLASLQFDIATLKRLR